MLGSCSSLLSSIGKRWVLAGAIAFAASALPEDVTQQAEAALQAGHAKDAEALVRTALAKGDRPDLHRMLGDCLEAEGDFKNAAVEYRTAATADPSEPNLFAFGSELLKYRGYPQAVQVFSYAAAHFPGSARIIVGLGIGQYSTGQ